MWVVGKQESKEKRNIYKELFEDTKGYITEKEAKRWIVKYFKANVAAAVEHTMGVKLFPFQEIIIKSMLQKDYVLGILSRGIGKCADQNCLIDSNSGLLPLGEIKVGDIIQSKNSRNRVIDRWVEPKASGRIIKYGKGLDSKVHFQHKFYVLDISDFTHKYIEAQHLDPKKHFMPIKVGADHWGNEGLVSGFNYERNPLNRNKKQDYIMIEDELPYLLGLIVGDGHIGKGKSNLISFTSNDEENTTYFKNHFLKALPDNKIRELDGNNDTREIRVNSDKFHKLLEHIGFTSEDKLRIPSKISNSSKENVSSFLSGLFDTHGSVWVQRKADKNSRSCHIEFYSCSEILIRQVHCLLLKLGVMSSVSLKAKEGETEILGKKCNNRNNYRLTISSRRDVRAFYENVGFRLSRKQKVLKEYIEYSKDSRMGESNCYYMPHLNKYLYEKYGTINGLLRKQYVNLSMEKAKLALDSKKLDDIDAKTIAEFLKHNFYYDRIASITEEEFETIGITVENEHNYWGNGMINHNSFGTAIYAGLEAMFTPNCRIAIISKTFRQSRLLFQTLEDISYKVEASLFSECIVGKPSHGSDQWTMKFDNGSVIMALPLGDGCVSLSTRTTYENHGIQDFNTVLPKNIDYEVDHQEFTTKGKQVWSNGQFRETDQQFYNGFRDIKKITTKKGFSIGATLNHKFKTTDGQDIVWVKTEDYEIDDIIMIDKSIRWHKGDTNLTEDECYAFGALIGNGCFRKDGSYLLGFATNDSEMVDYLSFGSPFNWKQSDKYHWYGSGGQKMRDEYLGKFNYLDQENRGTLDKHIPSPILNSSKQKMSAFIRGLYDTDGGVQVQTTKGGTSISVNFYNTSERLIDDLQYVLLHYGIVANKTARNRKFDKRLGEVDWSTSYELHVTGEDVKIFAEEIGFRLKRKQKVLQNVVAAKKRWRSLKDNLIPVNLSILEDISTTRIPKGKRIGNFRGIASIQRRGYITRDQLKLFVDNYRFTNDPRLEGLEALCNPSIYFDTVEKIEDGQAPTADLHVPDGHEYCANGFFSHNSKLRGFRFNCIIIDEMLLMPEKVLNEVIMPFLSTNANVDKRSEAEEIYDQAIEAGLIIEEEYEQIKNNHPLFRNNKMIGLSSASYQFEYLYKLYCEYKNKILSGTSDGKPILKDGSNKLEGSYAIFQMSYDIAPKGLYNESLLDKARSEMSGAQFKREFGSQFTDESSGYFSAQRLETCTVQTGVYPCAQLRGHPNGKYVLAVDPNASESDTSDLFAMVLFKIGEDDRFTQVHTYGVAGLKYSDHIRYFHYLLTNFNIEFIVMDNAGGIQFVRACQESKIFQDAKIPLDIITEVDLDKFEPNQEQEELRKLSKEYNRSKGKIIYLQKFSSDWLRQSNEDLQFTIDSGKIRFASEISAIDAEFQKAQKVDIDIDNLVFTGEENTDFLGKKIEDDYGKLDKVKRKRAKQLDFIEHQEFLMTLTRRQIASIEPVVSQSGNTMQFVLPKSLQNQKGKDRARRDLYTAVLMGNWVIKKYNKMRELPQETIEEWIPTLLDN